MAAQTVGSLIINLEANVAKLSADMQATRREVGGALDSIEKDSRRAANALEQTAGSANLLAKAGGAIAAGFSLGVVKDIVLNVAAALNQAQIASERLQKSLFYANGGNLRAIAQDIDWLRALSNRLGADFEQAAGSYAQFAGAVKGTSLAAHARQVFESLTTATSAFGLSASSAQGAMLALVQMAGKGVVQSEEFKQQLAEHLPVATQAAARALNVTTGEFTKMLESGQVLAADFLPKFAAELQKMSADAANFGGEAQKASARFTNAWGEMKTEVAQSGLGAFVSSQLAMMADKFKGIAEAIREARAQGAGFWGQMGSGGWVALKAFTPTLNGQFKAVSTEGRMAQLRQKIVAQEKTLTDFSVSGSLESKKQVLAQMRAELAELEKKTKTVGADTMTAQRQAEAREAAIKDAKARVKIYAEDDSRLSDRDKYDKSVKKEADAYKLRIQELKALGMGEGSEAVKEVERAHQTALANMREKFDKSQAAERRKAGAQARKEDGAIDAIQREIMGVEKLSAAEKVRFEIAEGKYAGMSAASQQRLMTLAAELDSVRQLRQENKKFLTELNRDVEVFEAHQRDVAKRLRGGEYNNSKERLDQEHAQRSLDISSNDGLSDEEKAKYGRLEDRRHERAVDDLRSSERQSIGLDPEEQQIRDQYERRRQLIMEATTLTETERANYVRMNQERLNADMLNLERNRASAMLSSTSQLFDNLAGLAASFKGKNSAIYRAMFAASKAFAIADSIIKIQQAVAAAAASGPFPANLGAMATVVSATAGLVSSITSTNLTGMAHDGIDSVPREGTWLLQKGERVIDNRTNADLKTYLQRMNQQEAGGGKPVEVSVMVQCSAPNVSARAEEREKPGGGREILVLIESVVDSKIHDSMMPDGSIYQFVKG
ncbi:tape measure protein [Chromobacterium haemolyticum]|uniref:tape measure protein n=1 Tax=Chromobacterium haemolyticum TaxID=394935 RepID=UPI0009DA3F3F|nr:tape measure protein [Chromobacterium haemolyticum]OQS41817.1 hypothetical protein B0T39_07720 [Chromobacterium haemolyticum]